MCPECGVLRKLCKHADKPAAPPAERSLIQRSTAWALDRIKGKSRVILELIERVRRLAPYSAPVLLVGERGTGKELVARALHALSPPAALPILSLSCGEVPATLFESEVFGHRRGAYTGATCSKLGCIGQAEGSTLFMDEVNSTPLPVQAKLLRVISEGEYRPVGAEQSRRCDV